MTNKKKYHLALNPKAHNRIKRLAAKTGCAPGDVVEALTSLTYHVPEQVFLGALKIATMRPQSGWVVDDEGKVPFVRSLFSPEEK